MTTSHNPTAPATRRTRPDGWLSLQGKWHWTPTVGSAMADACGQMVTVTSAKGQAMAFSRDLRDDPPPMDGIDGRLCFFCQEAAARFQTPA